MSVDLIPGAYVLNVTCTNAKHAPRVANIAAFTPSEISETSYLSYQYRWADVVVRSKKARTVVDGVLVTRSALTVDQVVDDEPFQVRKHGLAREGEFILEGRTRYVMECPLCRIRVAIRAETMDDELDRRREAGQATIELRSLAAILK